MVPLNEALPQFAESSICSAPVVTSRTRDTAAITQLRSGLTVASENVFGQFCAVGGESGLTTECLCCVMWAMLCTVWELRRVSMCGVCVCVCGHMACV